MSPGFPRAYLAKPVCAKTRALKFSRGICWHHGCCNPVRSGRSDCNTCHARKSRLGDPVRYIFANLRASARKRRIGFSLTFADFLQFCRETNYLERVGKEPGSLTVDRIDPAQPYRLGNIRALTYWENVTHSVEGMKHPAEPIARALALASGKDAKAFGPFLKQARAILDQVETLQRLEREEAERIKAISEKEPF